MPEGTENKKTQRVYNVLAAAATLIATVGVGPSLLEKIWPKNQPPAAKITATKQSGTAPLEVTFDGTKSSDPEGGELKYTWTVDNQVISHERSFKHHLTAPGEYVIALIVEDNKKSQHQDSTTVTVTSAKEQTNSEQVTVSNNPVPAASIEQKQNTPKVVNPTDQTVSNLSNTEQGVLAGKNPIAVVSVVPAAQKKSMSPIASSIGQNSDKKQNTDDGISTRNKNNITEKPKTDLAKNDNHLNADSKKQVAATGFINSVSPASMLAAHNQWRSQAGSPDIAWSDKLAQTAQALSDKLRDRNCTTSHSGNVYDENIFKAGALVYSSGRREFKKKTAVEVTKTWSRDSKGYSNMIRKSANKIGCAMSMCEDKSQLWVCYYYPQEQSSGSRQPR